MRKSHQKRGPISKETRAAARENTSTSGRDPAIPWRPGMIETNVRARRAAAHPASAALIPTKQRIDQLADRFGKRLVIICSFCLVPDELPGRPDLTPCLGMHLFISQSIGRVGTMLQGVVKGIVQAKRRHPKRRKNHLLLNHPHGWSWTHIRLCTALSFAVIGPSHRDFSKSNAFDRCPDDDPTTQRGA